MTLRQLRDRLSVLQIAIATATVVAGNGVAWTSVALAAAFTLLAFVRRLPPEPSPRSQRAWTFLVFMALLATIARAFLQGEFLDAGVDFLLLLVVQRMFNRQRAREHMQLLLLGTLMLVVGAVVNTGLNFPILFALYLVVAIMTLLANHLLSEGERLGARVQAEVARAGARSKTLLWRQALQVAAMAGVGGLAVFLVFPRFGVGVFLRGAIARDVRSGFSGEVQLGGFGRIKSDPTVVARMVPMSEVTLEPHLTWHLRGSSLDRYQDGRWTQSRASEPTPLVSIGTYSVLAPEGRALGESVPGVGARAVVPRPIDGFAASRDGMRVQITLEDIGVDAVFIVSDPIAVRLRPRGTLEDRSRLRGGFNQEIRIDKLPGPIQYEFVSRTGTPTADELRAVGRPSTPASLVPYLQRSPKLSPELTALARSLTDGAATRYDEVDAILRHLEGFRYSLELEPSARVARGADPIEGFLFDTKTGHCEYFATAMAVLLREIGVPTRIVNGYYGAHWNEIGEFYAVRQADAHSWVEVNFGALGWVTFDPTPPSGRAAGDVSLWPALRQYVDALRDAYLQSVIDYNLTKQLALLENLGLRGGSGGRWRLPSWRTVLPWAGLAIVVAFAVRWAWRRRRDPVRVETRLYRRVEARLAARGHVRRADESAVRFVERVQARTGREDGPQGVGGDALRRFAERYDALRFGPAVRGSALAELRRLAADAIAALR